MATSTISRTRPRLAFAAVAGVAIAAFALAQGNQSGAQFSAQEETTVAVGSGHVDISLTDDGPHVLSYAATNVAPGWSDTFTVAVTNESTVTNPSNITDVRTYVTGAPSGDFADELTITVDDGEDPFSGSWSDLSSNFGNPLLAPWMSTNTGDDTRVFTITVELPSNGMTDNTLQGDDAALSLTFEARNHIPA